MGVVVGLAGCLAASGSTHQSPIHSLMCVLVEVETYSVEGGVRQVTRLRILLSYNWFVTEHWYYLVLLYMCVKKSFRSYL